MSEFRQLKARFFSICSSSGWRGSLEEALPEGDALKTALNPLLALLPRPQCRLPAAYGLGLALSRLALADMERARVFMRRMMWSLNEESGNLGWGVPEAMGAALAMSPVLARAYSRVFLSYGYETGREDNFLDYAPLRCGVYVGAAMLAGADFSLARAILPYLEQALAAPEAVVRASAALLLLSLAQAAPVKDFSGQGRADWVKALNAAKAAGMAAPQGSGELLLDYLDLTRGTIERARAKDVLGQAARAVSQGLGRN